MRLLSLFGLDARLRRLRILTAEGALAVEDRAQLLRFAWEEERQRLQWMLGLVIAVIGLTTIAIALLSVAIVVHFWDSVYRAAAAWSVAAVWVALWLAAVLALVALMRRPSAAFEPAMAVLRRDLNAVQDCFGHGAQHEEEEQPAERQRPATQEELLARIERQRLRVVTTMKPVSDPFGEKPPANESLGATAVRLAREHPVAAGVAAASIIAAVGPRRLLRWAGVVVPVLWRMR